MFKLFEMLSKQIDDVNKTSLSKFDNTIRYNTGQINSEFRVVTESNQSFSDRNTFLISGFNGTPNLQPTFNFQEQFPNLLFENPETLYNQIITDARTIPNITQLMIAVNQEYLRTFMSNLTNIYNNAPKYFTDNFIHSTDGFRLYQRFFYLITYINYVDEHSEDEDLTTLQFFDDAVKWIVTRRDPNIKFMLIGPQDSQNYDINYISRYESLMSPTQTTTDITRYQQLSTTQTISADLLNVLQFLIKNPNVFVKTPDEAKKYNISINTSQDVSMEIDTKNNLVFDCQNVNLGDTTEQNINARYEKLNDVEISNVVESRITTKKLEQIFNMYSRIKVLNFVVTPNVYSTSLNIFNQVFIVFDGITCSERNVYNNANSSNLMIGGKFVIDTNGNYSFVQDVDAITYKSTQTRVKHFKFYITTDPNTYNTIVPYQNPLTITANMIYQHPVVNKYAQKVLPLTIRAFFDDGTSRDATIDLTDGTLDDSSFFRVHNGVAYTYNLNYSDEYRKEHPDVGDFVWPSLPQPMYETAMGRNIDSVDAITVNGDPIIINTPELQMVMQYADEPAQHTVGQYKSPSINNIFERANMNFNYAIEKLIANISKDYGEDIEDDYDPFAEFGYKEPTVIVNPFVKIPLTSPDANYIMYQDDENDLVKMLLYTYRLGQINQIQNGLYYFSPTKYMIQNVNIPLTTMNIYYYTDGRFKFNNIYNMVCLSSTDPHISHENDVVLKLNSGKYSLSSQPMVFKYSNDLSINDDDDNALFEQGGSIAGNPIADTPQQANYTIGVFNPNEELPTCSLMANITLITTDSNDVYEVNNDFLTVKRLAGTDNNNIIDYMNANKSLLLDSNPIMLILNVKSDIGSIPQKYTAYPNVDGTIYATNPPSYENYKLYYNYYDCHNMFEVNSKFFFSKLVIDRELAGLDTNRNQLVNFYFNNGVITDMFKNTYTITCTNGMLTIKTSVSSYDYGKKYMVNNIPYIINCTYDDTHTVVGLKVEIGPDSDLTIEELDISVENGLSIILTLTTIEQDNGGTSEGTIKKYTMTVIETASSDGKQLVINENVSDFYITNDYDNNINQYVSNSSSAYETHYDHVNKYWNENMIIQSLINANIGITTAQLPLNSLEFNIDSSNNGIEVFPGLNMEALPNGLWSISNANGILFNGTTTQYNEIYIGMHTHNDYSVNFEVPGIDYKLDGNDSNVHYSVYEVINNNVLDIDAASMTDQKLKFLFIFKVQRSTTSTQQESSMSTQSTQPSTQQVQLAQSSSPSMQQPTSSPSMQQESSMETPTENPNKFSASNAINTDYVCTLYVYQNLQNTLTSLSDTVQQPLHSQIIGYQTSYYMVPYAQYGGRTISNDTATVNMLDTNAIITADQPTVQGPKFINTCNIPINVPFNIGSLTILITQHDKKTDDISMFDNLEISVTEVVDHLYKFTKTVDTNGEQEAFTMQLIPTVSYTNYENKYIDPTDGFPLNLIDKQDMKFFEYPKYVERFFTDPKFTSDNVFDTIFTIPNSIISYANCTLTVDQSTQNGTLTLPDQPKDDTKVVVNEDPQTIHGIKSLNESMLEVSNIIKQRDLSEIAFSNRNMYLRNISEHIVSTFEFS